MGVKQLFSTTYPITKENEISHQAIIEALGEAFDVEVVDKIDENCSYVAPKLIIRRKNGLEEAQRQAKNFQKEE